MAEQHKGRLITTTSEETEAFGNPCFKVMGFVDGNISGIINAEALSDGEEIVIAYAKRRIDNGKI